MIATKTLFKSNYQMITVHNIIFHYGNPSLTDEVLIVLEAKTDDNSVFSNVRLCVGRENLFQSKKKGILKNWLSKQAIKYLNATIDENVFNIFIKEIEKFE